MAQVHARVLRLAANTVGSVEKLAIALAVDAADLARWIEGEKPPMEAFLDALDIVAGGSRGPGAGGGDPGSPRSPA